MTTPDTTPPAPSASSAPAAFSFVIIDLTTDATAAAMKPGPVLDPIAAALEEQIANDFAPAHGAAPCAFRVGSGPTDRATNEIAINLRDTIPEAPTALAYHQVVNGVPDIEVGVDLFTSLTSGSESLSSGIDHEVLETLGDAGANGWKDRADSSGQMDAEEMCDFVQNTGYSASNGVALSNFVLPSFFVPGAPGPWDHLGVMKDQRDVSQGYGIVAVTPTETSQIGGDKRAEVSPRPKLGQATIDGRCVCVTGVLTAAQRARKSHPYSRAHRRGIRL
jgi:hypothetical protein